MRTTSTNLHPFSEEILDILLAHAPNLGNTHLMLRCNSSALVQVAETISYSHAWHHRTHGQHGNDIKVSDEIPSDLKDLANEKRKELIETVSGVDDDLAEIFLMEEEPTVEQLKEAIRRSVVSNQFAPVFMGSAYKNRGVQLLLDGVVDYLPAPHEVENIALDLNKDEEPVKTVSDPKAPLVGLAFKLEEGRFGQLTYLRIYQGTITKGMTIVNTRTGEKLSRSSASIVNLEIHLRMELLIML